MTDDKPFYKKAMDEQASVLKQVFGPKAAATYMGILGSVDHLDATLGEKVGLTKYAEKGRKEGDYADALAKQMTTPTAPKV